MPDVYQPSAALALGRFCQTLGAFLAIWFLCATPAAAADPPPQAPMVPEAALEAVLVLRSADSADRFLGSAFLWGEAAQVAVTNAHVIGDAEELRLIDRTGREELGLVIASDPVRDVAVILVGPGADGQPRPGLTPSQASPEIGLKVYALGAPLGAEFTLTEGLISAMARQIDMAVPLRFVQHDAAVNPGSSGGPLVDSQGKLVGMNSRIADGSRMFVGIAYAIAATDLTRIVEGLIDETLPAFPTLGLNARPIDRKLAEALGVPVAGLLVDAVAPGGRAAEAGLRSGDILLAVGDQPLQTPGAFAFAIEAALTQGALRLRLAREGVEADAATELEVVLTFAAPDTAPEALGLRLRGGASDLPEPERIRSYRPAALGLTLGPQGLVTALTDNSPAALAGLTRGDRILAVNGTALPDDQLQGLEIGAPVLLRLEAPGGATRHLWLDPWGAVTGPRPPGGANVLDPAVVVF